MDEAISPDEIASCIYCGLLADDWRRHRLRRRGSLALLGVLAFAVLLGVRAAPASAIENGQAISTAPQWAAYVTTVSRFLLNQTWESACTGTIVANDWVMTAAHCVVQEKNGKSTRTKLPLSKFEIVLGRSNLDHTWQGGQWTVNQVQVDPTWNPEQLTGDVALLHLKGRLPSGALPLPLAPASLAMSDGQSPLAYGYGCTSVTYTKQALAQGDLSKYSCTSSKVLRLTISDSYQQQSSCATALEWCLHRVGTSEILFGDSGGPWVPDDTNAPYVVGITSHDRDPQLTTSTTVNWQYHMATRVTDPSTHAWIDNTASILQGTTGTIYRNPSTGASWLFESDGFLHRIPDGGTYLCLTGAGDPVANEPAFKLAELPLTNSPATCQPPAPALVPVTLGTLCNGADNIDAVNGCPYNGVTTIGSDSFTYTILIEDNDDSVTPAYWDLIDFPATSCRRLSLTFGMPTDGSAPGDTASIEVVTASLAPQSASVAYGAVASFNATLDGGPWSLENSATAADDQIAINGTASCLTTSGY